MVSNGVDARLPHLEDPDSPDAEAIGWVLMEFDFAPLGMHVQFGYKIAI